MYFLYYIIIFACISLYFGVRYLNNRWNIVCVLLQAATCKPFFFLNFTAVQKQSLILRAFLLIHILTVIRYRNRDRSIDNITFKRSIKS